MTPIALRIIDALLARMADMRTVHGYQTDCGKNVFLAVRDIDPDDLPAAVLWPGTETVERYYESVDLSRPFEIAAHREVQPSEDPAIVAELLRADLVSCMTAREFRYPFSAGNAEPTPGAAVTGDTTGHVGTVAKTTLTSGAWADGDAAGVLVLRGHHNIFFDETLSTDGAAGFALVDPSVRLGIDAVTLAAGGLAESIEYVEGGADSYPEAGDTIVSVRAEFKIIYRHRAGDPYRQ
jgi:hypothetical protein